MLFILVWVFLGVAIAVIALFLASHCERPCPVTPAGFRFNALGSVLRVEGGFMPIEVTATDAEKFRLQVVPVSNSGKPAKIEAGSLKVVPVAGAGVNPIAVVETDDTFSVQADFPDGSASVDQEFTVTGDADLGAGVVEISDTVLLHVTSEQASNLGLTSLGAVPR